MNKHTMEREQDKQASRLAWVFMVAMPAFVLGGAVTFAALWLGPVAVRDKVIAEYEADVMRLARKIDAEPVLDGAGAQVWPAWLEPEEIAWLESNEAAGAPRPGAGQPGAAGTAGNLPH